MPIFPSSRSYFSSLSRESLLREVSEIMKRFPEVRQYYESKFNAKTEYELLEKYKKRLKNEFFPDRGFGQGKLSVARKVITDYKKIASCSFYYLKKKILMVIKSNPFAFSSKFQDTNRTCL